MLLTVEINDPGDDVQVLAGADAARLIVSGKVKIVVVAVLKHETWTICGCSAVVSSVNQEVESRFVVVVGSHECDIAVELNDAPFVL